MQEARKNDEAETATEWVSLTEAAKMLGSHRETVLQLAIKGRLVVEHRGNWTFVSRDSIDRYLATVST